MSASPEHQAGSPAAHADDDLKPIIPDATDSAPPAEESDAAPAETPEERPELGGDISDDESVLSEVDEAQFEDFDPATVDVEEDRPQLAIDEDNLKLIGRHKRKRSEDGGEGDRPRRKKEGRREKKSRRMLELEEGGERVRRRDQKRREPTPPEDDETLDPATRMFRVSGYWVALIVGGQDVAGRWIALWTKP